MGIKTAAVRMETARFGGLFALETPLTVHVLQLSDVHFNATGQPVHGQDADARLATVLNVCLRAVPPLDLVVLSGDLTEDGTAEACQRLRRALTTLSAPAFAVPGNHDVTSAVREAFDTEATTLGSWRIVGIDTTRAGQIHGTIDVERELNRLDGWDQRPTLLVMHHPPLSISTNAWFQLDGALELLSALESRPHVKGIASGHLHHPFELRSASGMPVLGCPSTLIAFQHARDHVVVGGSGRTGARLLNLADDGTLSSKVLVA